MAFEIPDQGQQYTLPASTGILGSSTAPVKFRFVTVNASGQAAFPAAGASVAGVLQGNVTRVNEAATIFGAGISKVEATGSTVAVGDLVATSSVGKAVALSGGAYAVGRVVLGSSGSSGRYLTVRLESIGTT